MLHLEFGQHWLAQPHPLQTFELGQGCVEFTIQVRLAAKEAIGNFLGRNTRTGNIVLVSQSFDFRRSIT
jgi:hypothetical protein